MATPDDDLLTKTEAELRLIIQDPAAHAPGLVAAARHELQRRGPTPPPATNDYGDYGDYAAAPKARRGLVLLGLLLVLLGLGIVWYKNYPAAPVAQAPRRNLSPDSLKLETAVAAPLPKFDIESPILRQLALLPPAERSTAGPAMRQYQALTRRFWLAQYSTDFLLKQATAGPPNVPVFAQQLATAQGHWQVLRAGLGRGTQFPPGMAAHLARMASVARYQQAALEKLAADCAQQRPPRLDAPTRAAQQQVAQLLAPLLRQPGPLTVHLH